MPQTFQGRTEDAEAPFLGFDFWEKGKSVSGKVVKLFSAKPQDGKAPGQCYVIEVDGEVEVCGELTPRVSIGNLAGFQMAMQAANVAQLRVGDTIKLECTGIKPPTKETFSGRVNFALSVIR